MSSRFYFGEIFFIIENRGSEINSTPAQNGNEFRL